MLLFDSKDHDFSDLSFRDDRTQENSVCAINYSEDYKQLHLAWLQIHKESTERAFYLSKLVIEQNPSHYAVYLDRWRLVNKLNKPYDDELNFISIIILSNLKNYQVWNYRHVITQHYIEHLNKPVQTAQMHFTSQQDLITKDLEFVWDTLAMEPKNYHAFTYLYQQLPHFSPAHIQLELSRTLTEITNDMYNNSMWHYRLQLLKLSHDWIDSELALVLKCIDAASDNESVWAHIQGYTRLI